MARDAGPLDGTKAHTLAHITHACQYMWVQRLEKLAIYKPLCSVMLRCTQLLQPAYSEHLRHASPYVHRCRATCLLYSDVTPRPSTNHYVQRCCAERNVYIQSSTVIEICTPLCSFILRSTQLYIHVIVNTWNVQTHMFIHATLNVTFTATWLWAIDIYKPLCSFMLR